MIRTATGERMELWPGSRGLRLRAGLYASGITLALAGASQATAQQAAQVQDEDQVIERIVVTGSRIARQDFVSNTPIMTVSTEMLENTSSFALETQLLKFPQFSGSGNSQYSTGYFNSGASTLNLRNLGDNRNLVLIDGRRPQPSTSTLAVDINTIPAALIRNVEVMTGGASAVYGADAVSGVVNFLLRDDFEGVQIDGAYGISEEGDNQTINLSVLMGGNFAEGRGNAVLSFDYADRGEVRNVDREFFRRGFEEGRLFSAASFLSNGYYKPFGNTPSQGAIDAYFGQHGAAAGAVSPGASLGFNNDGTSFYNVTGGSIYNYQNPMFPRYVIDTSTGTATVKQNFTADTLASLPLERWSAFGRANYEITPSMSAFGQVSYSNYTSITQGGPPVADNFWQVVIPRGGDFPVPGDFGALLDSRADPDAPWILGKTLSFHGMGTISHKNQVFQVMLGIEGELPGTRDWTYEVYASRGETTIVDNGFEGFARFDRYQELMTAPNYGANFEGQWGTCTSGLSPFGELNGEGAGQFVTNPPQVVSRDCIDYIGHVLNNYTLVEQEVAEAILQGGLFELAAGEVRFSAGVGYRSQRYSFDPDGQLAPDAAFAANLIGQFGQGSVSGSNDVREGYLELLVPLVSDAPLVQALDLNLAYRFSDYSSSGGSNTWKADLSWQMVDQLRMRGGYQRAARAPNVVEQFSPPTLVFSGGTDACQTDVGAPYANIPSNPNRAQVQDLCRALMGDGAPADLDTYTGSGSASLNTYPIGNPDLSPEVAKTYTIGAVFSPDLNLPLNARFQAAIDYYSITIDGAIGYVGADLSYQLCFNADGQSNPTYDPNNIYCQGILRAQEPGTGYPIGVQSPYLNQAGIKTTGLDVQLDLGMDAGPGTLDFNIVINHLDSFKRSTAPGQPFVEYSGFNGGYFDWQVFTSASYSVDRWSGGLRWRWLDSTTDTAYLINPCASDNCIPGVSSYNVFDGYVNWQMSDTLRFRGGIDNLFDKTPPVVGGRLGQTSVQEYDILGRRFYAGVTVNF